MNEIRSYPTVTRWVAEVNRYYGLDESEWETRLSALAVYCERVQRTPDELIREAREQKDRKVDLMRTLRQIARELHPESRAAHDWENVVRSFFIHNGARVVVRPYED